MNEFLSKLKSRLMARVRAHGPGPLAPGEREVFARDLAADLAALRSLGRGREGDELHRMLEALGIDEQALARAAPGALRDLSVVCAHCHSTAECDRALDAGSAPEHFKSFCPNDFTLEALLEAEYRPAPIVAAPTPTRH